jgi:hypothetical protein
MKDSRISPTTLSHSAVLLYVANESGYAQAVAGQGKQHEGCPGSKSIDAQNRPSMTANCQREKCVEELDMSTYILLLLGLLLKIGLRR